VANLPAIGSRCDALDEQLDAADVSGDSDQLRRKRNAIIYELDQLTLTALRQSFREICGLGYSYDDWRSAPANLAARLHYAEFGNTTKDHTGGDVGFVGREKLMERIHRTVNGYDSSGYTVITGVPGIGKSAVMAQLIRSERWTHHYVAGSLKNGRTIVESIGAQLIRNYDLPYDGQLYTESDPCGPLNLLLDAATRDPANWPVVIVIDGFDESDDLQLGALNLPENLPSGAFIIVTRRPPGSTGHLFAQHVQPVEIVNDDANKDDLREFIGRFISEYQEMHSAIAAFGRSAADFTEDLVRQGDGNFMYVTSILPNIRDGLMTPADLAEGKLPERLSGYYRQHCWDRMKEVVASDNFSRYFVPVASLLTGRAARYGPVTVTWLVERSGLRRHDVLKVLDAWSQFLVREGKNGELVRIYHSSFRDFLDKALRSEDVAGNADGPTEG
jgi:hypothetical protein